MTSEELNRYSRQIILPEIGLECQELLKHAKVLVIGAGGLGCPVLQYLVAAGIGNVGIVDDDRVDESNLQRQVIYNSGDIGKSKAIVAVEKLSVQNPYCKLRSYPVRLNIENALEILSGYDIVVDGSDNFPTRYLVNDACVMLNKPFVFGSVFKFEGQLAVFNCKGSATYRCLYPQPPGPGESPNCADIGVLGVLPGMIGMLQSNEVIKMITGIGEVLTNKLLVFDALKMSFETFSFGLNPTNKVIKSFSDYNVFCGLRVNEISVGELEEKMRANENIQIIDVREPAEYAVKNIGALLIPLAELKNNIGKIRTDVPVVIHCQSGVRSKKAVELLLEQGFDNIFSLRGGIAAMNQDWVLANS